MRISVMYPIMPGVVETAYPYAELVRDRGLGRLWFGTSLFLSEQMVMAALAARYPGIGLGSAVSLTVMRSVPEMALTSRSLSAMTGVPFCLGIGPGGESIQRSMRGAPYRRPGAAVRDHIESVRGLLEGRRVTIDSESVTMDTTISRIPAPRVELGAGVLRPRMARIAGTCADAAITWMSTPEYLAETVIPELARGAAERERATPRVVTVLHVATARTGRDPVPLALGALSGHLTAPHYLDMLRLEGVEATADDPVGGARGLVDAGIFAHGSPERIAEIVVRHARAGVDELVLNTCGVYSQEGAVSAYGTLVEAVDIAEQALSDVGGDPRP